MNKSIVTFTRGTLAQATPLWQYDYGQILEINGLDLPSTYQVHFCNCSDTQTITVLGNADGVLIPDNLLQTGKTVIAYIYLHTGADDGETEYKITIPVRPRPAPSDIPPTPEQQSALDEAIAALNSAVEDVEDIADGIQDQIDAALAEAKESGEFDGAPGAPGTDGADGNNIWYDNSSLIESGSDVAARIADLEGRTGVSPAADDIVFAKAPRSGHIDTMYIIRRVWGPLADLTFVATITGPQGDPGFSPVARVTEIEGGHCVTIYDLAHPDGQSFDVLDGAPGPEGPPGRDGEITEALKQALLQLAQKVAYIDDQGQTYYQALYDALYPPKELVSISAVYTQSSTVYDTDSLDSLKTDLVVTGTYDDQTTATIPASDYTLTGTLTAGTSTITVTCSGKTTTFTVVVTHAPGVFAVTNTLSGCTNSNTATSVAEGASYSGTITANSGYTLTGATVSITMGGVDITASAYSSGSISIASVTGALVINVAAVAVVLSSISAVYTQSGTVYDTDTLDSLKDDLTVTAYYSDSSTATVAAADYTLSGDLTHEQVIVDLLDGATWTDGIAFDDNGNELDRPTLSCSDFLPVTQGTVYTYTKPVSGGTDAYGMGLYLYDSNKGWISRDTTAGTQSGTEYVKTYTPASNVAYVRLMAYVTAKSGAEFTYDATPSSWTSTITASYGGKTTTFSVTVTEHVVLPLYNWDLTQSLTDTEQGLVVDTTGTFVEGTGLSFTANNKYADFGAYELDRTYELTIEALNRSDTTSYRRFLMTYKTNNTSTYGHGLIFSTNKGGVEFYTGSWQTAILQTSSIADLDGRWAIYTGTGGVWKVYRNGVYIGQSTTAIAKNADHTKMLVGSSASDYTRVKITSFKVYEGEVINR